ncbi:hypothetical protein [Carboxylicivirga linearis]|uniref:Uncharacterized protein n=1 Tax=Carboxylicivirga linearis TaxID=1628157 RepID=A0ABS5JUI6_9BACT|nr:hypothetical protein [Carboxylicivirga linearis]MBS2098557.1 hypothetical protein [Carboxylicivirga linearis]
MIQNQILYTEPLKQRHADIEELKRLALIENRSEDEDLSLLDVSNRLFLNDFAEQEIIDTRNRFFDFWDIETNDAEIPVELSGTADQEHLDRIDEIINSLEFGDDLKPFKLNKLADQHPEIPFYTLMSIIDMELQGKEPAKILRKIKEACSVYPENRLLELMQDQYLIIQDKKPMLLNDSTFGHSTLSQLMKGRQSIHPLELYIAHAALFEFVAQKDHLLMTDSFLFTSMQVYPEAEEVINQKTILFDLHILDYCIEKYAPELNEEG